MDNASIRAWANANGIAVSKNGNVAPDVAIAYAMAMAEEKPAAPKKEKAPKEKKEKKEKKVVPIESGDLQTEFGEIFSAGTIKMVVAQHPERSREILTVGAAFLANGMRSRYAAIGKAINGETPRVKAEKAATPGEKVKASRTGKAAEKAATATSDAHMVILPDGVRIVCASLADANVIATRVPGAIVAGIA